MKVTAPFGIITACHAGDCFLVKATCASIRHSMPDVPICVIVDGEFSIDELKTCYGVQELRVADFSDSRLPPICAGSSRTKFAAIWESPFERFLCIDSDVVVLGDWTSILKCPEWDFLCLGKPSTSSPPRHIVEHFFFCLSKLEKFDKDFDHNNGLYFCAGAYAAARNCLDVEDFLKAASFEEANPGTFHFSDQGIFNYLVMKAASAGVLQVKVDDRQYILPDHPREETVALFGNSRSKLPVSDCEPKVLHFCGTKPLLQYRDSCDYVFTAFRFLHYCKVSKDRELAMARAWLKILCEELCYLLFRFQRKTHGWISSETSLESGLFTAKTLIEQRDRSNKVEFMEGVGDSKADRSDEKIVAKFGIVTACHGKDYFMAKATCASIRYFMPNVPICVIVDGDFSVSELQDAYGVIVMRTGEIRDARLREMCTHSTRSKLAALWEGPFERYLWVDCDTVVLGDIVHAEQWEEADFWAMTSIVPGSVPDRNLRHYFLDPDEMKTIDPDFDANQHPLFCDGAYVIRRGCLNLDRTFSMWMKTQTFPDLFSWTRCQGLTNYMIFSSECRGELSVRVANRQYIVPDHSRKEFEQKFGGNTELPRRDFADACVVHFCGTKPMLQNRSTPSGLFTAFRKLHYENVYGRGVLPSVRCWMKILMEEMQVLKPRLSRKLGIQRAA